jgi:1-aminocyclopropane-1-carboxylate deaminase/D-cysteine desulfhydrase-like pyridoxal-dependent ACC family enzyme
MIIRIIGREKSRGSAHTVAIKRTDHGALFVEGGLAWPTGDCWIFQSAKELNVQCNRSFDASKVVCLAGDAPNGN